jgi:hypothetical protein
MLIDTVDVRVSNADACSASLQLLRCFERGFVRTPTRIAESKKPNLAGWAKCLNLLVLMRGIEPPTY